MRSACAIFSRGLVPAALLFAAGCSENKPAAPSTAPAKARTTAAASTGSSSAPKLEAVVKSEFATDGRLRDPFFPNVKRMPDPVAATTTAQQPATVEKALRDGFQGVFGTGQSRLALINNVMLEPGRTAIIPIRSGAQRSQVTVRVREILSNSVVLEVQGKTITISTKQ